ncbi:oxidoreductase family protein [Mycobacterium sp. 050134]|uniref:oxidoreductase family protein n=1 Tax=Mycobacterium sp. 050134 TaxID=3096111 RepID=UPI002EDB8D01
MTVTEYAVAEYTPEVLTGLLSRRPGWGALSIESVYASPVGTGQMANSYRLQLEYSERPDDAPHSLIAKVSGTDPTSRQMAVSTGAYQREVLFYQHLSDLTGIRSPRCFYGEIADDLCGFVLLLEDLGPADAIDQLSGCTIDQADLALQQAAALHGGSWRHSRLAEQAWLPAEHIWNALGGTIPQIADSWLERFGHYLKPDHVAVVHRLGREVTAWLSTLGEHRTLWHGDFRLDNMLFDAHDGRTPIAVVDWQSTAAAPGIIDVSYFLGNSLTEQDRVDHERALVTEYHRYLLAHGVENYSADRCWREYQAHALYGLVLTIPVSLGVVATERGDAMFGAMASRAAEQVVANESFSALAALNR